MHLLPGAGCLQQLSTSDHASAPEEPKLEVMENGERPWVFLCGSWHTPPLAVYQQRGGSAAWGLLLLRPTVGPVPCSSVLFLAHSSVSPSPTNLPVLVQGTPDTLLQPET